MRQTVQLHPEQRRFRLSEALYRGFVGGRGAGKTWIGAYDLIRRAKRGRTYLAGSPTSVLLQDTTYPTFKAIASQLGVWDPAGVRLRPYPNVLLGTGALVRFRSADDPEMMRGPNLSGVWLDEASLMPADAYLINIAALRECGEQGWLSATFTPKGLSHWTYELFGKAAPNTAIFHARTKDNPFLPTDFQHTLEEQYPGAQAQQELEGRFVNVEGAEWPGEWFTDKIWFADWPLGLTIKTCALDPSKGKDAKFGDYRAFVSLGRDREGQLWCEADLAREPTPAIVATAIELNRTFRPDGFAVEINRSE